MEGMELSDNKKVKYTSYSLMMDARIQWEIVQFKYDVNQMTWAQFTKEFNEHFFNATITVEYWNKINSLQQGTMIIIKLMNKYRRLLRLCLEDATNEREKVQQLVKGLCPDIVVHVYQGDKLLASIEECFRIALQREYHINENLEIAKKKETQPTQTQNLPQG